MSDSRRINSSEVGDPFHVDTKCWVPNPQEAWVSATITKRLDTKNADQVELILVEDDGDNREHRIVASKQELAETSDKFWAPLRNPSILESLEDLTSLSYLNEPSVLHSIKSRYSQLQIYTYSGIVLIAVNPFQNMQSLYSHEMVQAYAGRQKSDLEPHLFAIAEDAYRCMTRDQQNQTIIVSGESGAGKTVSAKYVMRYFATVENDHKFQTNCELKLEMSETERQILSTNPIMEAFGNAKTIKNDNSSRFGKYIEIQFDNKQCISGARIRTYLLERSRLVYQPSGERNYHIFYQMLAGLTAQEKMELELTDYLDFNYLKQGGDGSLVIPGLDESQEFLGTKKAMQLIGIEEDQQFEIVKILAGLLHLGNVTVSSAANKAFISHKDKYLQNACTMFGLPLEKFAKWCTRRQITTKDEKIESQVSEKQALVVRDSVAKFIYVCLFEWLVHRMNQVLVAEPDNVKSFIGVLDIYGFEYFQKNSFEQFCINYANEKLQQEFNLHVFKLEQEEYVNEGLNWSFIEFSDNQNCIDLIESRVGILSLLDEESRLTQGSDASFVQKMHSNFYNQKKNKSYSVPRFGKSAFIIKHYALDVEYESDGFIEKNRDTVPDEHLELLKASTNTFLKSMVDHQLEYTAKAFEISSLKKQIANANRKPTLGAIFRNSLANLMDTINSTNVHYIRCIKPNDLKSPWLFQPNMVLSQLRACGVLETIRISCAGFPTRMRFEDFLERYYLLVPSEHWVSSPKDFAQTLLDRLSIENNQYQLGLTKLFLRSGVLAELERQRSARLSEISTVIQKYVRRHIAMTKYRDFRRLLKFLQDNSRSRHTIKKLRDLQKDIAATKLQTLIRSFMAKKMIHSFTCAIILIQATARGRIARADIERLILERHVVKIQSSLRGYCIRIKLENKINAATLIQSCWRRKSVRAAYKKAKIERQSVTHFKEVSFQLEKKVIELTQQLQQRISENKTLKNKVVLLERDKCDISEKLDTTQQNIATLQAELDQSLMKVEAAKKVTAEIVELQNVRHNLQERCESLLKQFSQLTEDYDNQKVKYDEMSKMYKQKTEKLETLQKSMDELKNTLQKSNPTKALENDIEFEALNSADANDVVSILYNCNSLAAEFYDHFVEQNHIPQPSSLHTLKKEDVLLPGRILVLIIGYMWNYSLYDASSEFLGSLIPKLKTYILKFEGEASLFPCIYWLSNIQELLSYISSSILKTFDIDSRQSNKGRDLALDTRKSLIDLQNFLYEYWMIETKKYLYKIIVPAVIETQALPGFVVSQGKSFINKILPSNEPEQPMDDLIGHLNNIDRAFKSYYMEHEVMLHSIDEILHLIGVTAFNNMIMRNKFLSWKRGLQINYNITRIEEWCKLHDILDGFLQLEHLLQATKLLQLKKNAVSDMEIIYDICWLLNPAQVQKLVTQYYLADYEEPIKQEVLKFVSDRAIIEGESKQLLLDAAPVERCNPMHTPAARKIELSLDCLKGVSDFQALNIEKLINATIERMTPKKR